MDELADIISRVTDPTSLDDTELRTASDELLDLYNAIRAGEIDEVEADNEEVLNQIADALESLAAETTARAERAAEREAAAAAIDARVAAASGEDGEDESAESEGEPSETEPSETEGTEGDGEAEPVSAEDEPAEVESSEADESAEVPVEAIAAAAVPAPKAPVSLAELAARRPARGAAPPARSESKAVRLLRESRYGDGAALAQAIIETRESFAGGGNNVDKVAVGRYERAFPEDRILDAADGGIRNTAKIAAVTDPALAAESWRDPALVASGGFCAPTEADYSLAQISGAQRPVRDSLASFMADRGGIRYNTPNDLADVLVDQSGGAVGEWTNATDESPGENVKSCQTVSCGTTQEVLTVARYTCLQFGNFGARAFPEWVTNWVANTAAAWARDAETAILDVFDTNSTPVTHTSLIGATREILGAIAQLAAAERNRQRMPRDARLRVYLPGWVVELMQFDIAWQGSVPLQVIDESTIRAWLNTLNINVTFYEDTDTGGGQVWGAQGPTDIRNFPSTVVWFLTHEGAYVFLDGGTLDLGVVRDSTLNQTNDYRIFSESFENTAYRGLFSYKVTSTVCPTGEAAALVDTGELCAAS